MKTLGAILGLVDAAYALQASPWPEEIKVHLHEGNTFPRRNKPSGAAKAKRSAKKRRRAKT